MRDMPRGRRGAAGHGEGAGDDGPGLVHIPQTGNAPLSVEQRRFNRLVRQVERLEAELKAERARWDGYLDFVCTKVMPVYRVLWRMRGEIALALYPYLGRPDFRGKRQRANLRDAILEILDGAVDDAGAFPFPELERIEAELLGPEAGADPGPEPEGLPSEELEGWRAEIEALAGQFGIDLAAHGIDFSLPPQELGSRLKALSEAMLTLGPEAFRKQFPGKGGAGGGEGAAPHRQRAKSKRTLDREAREREAQELRERDLGQLYKQLVKLLHPDLEQDPARRREKEEAMKRLTVAHEAGDVLTLLRLEVEWMHREQSNLSRLGEERLATYNQVLREQVAELRQQVASVGDHPRYAPLLPHILIFADRRWVSCEGALDEARTAVGKCEALLADLRSSRSLLVVKEVAAFQGEIARRRRRDDPFGDF